MKEGMARGRGNAKKRVADMSLPPEQRRRQRRGKGRGVKGTVAQMDHANNPEAAKQRRAFDRRESRAREDGDSAHLAFAIDRDAPPRAGDPADQPGLIYPPDRGG